METVLHVTDSNGDTFSCVVRCDESGWTVRREHTPPALGMSRVEFDSDGDPALPAGYGYLTVEVVP